MNGKKYDKAHVSKLIDEGTMDTFKMIDLFSSHDVEIKFSEDGRLWVNVDGKCVLRVYDADITIDSPNMTLEYKKEVPPDVA